MGDSDVFLSAFKQAVDAYRYKHGLSGDEMAVFQDVNDNLFEFGRTKEKCWFRWWSCGSPNDGAPRALRANVISQAWRRKHPFPAPYFCSKRSSKLNNALQL